MRHFINNVYHGIGYLLVCIGIFVLIGAAGNSDLGVALSQVMRLGLSGLVMMAFGAFFVWWRV